MAVAEKPEVVAGEPRSERGRRRRGMDQRLLSPLEQIRARPGGTTGPWAYYLRPEGATIRDALILYPNGAKLPANEDARGKYSTNADYYQALQRAKGFEYIGPTLTPEGARRLVQILQANQADEVLDLEDQIAECEADIKTSDRPDWRDNQRRRKSQLERRLTYVKQQIDPDALIAELNEIARAQRMSRVSPETLAVMREMMGEQEQRQTQRFADMVKKFQSTSERDDSESFTGVDRIDQ